MTIKYVYALIGKSSKLSIDEVFYSHFTKTEKHWPNIEKICAFIFVFIFISI